MHPDVDCYCLPYGLYGGKRPRDKSEICNKMDAV